MIPRIRRIEPLEGYFLYVVFDDGKEGIYDVNEDIDAIAEYADLRSVYGLFQQVQLDESRTCVYWNDRIDLPSDAIYAHCRERQKGVHTK